MNFAKLLGINALLCLVCISQISFAQTFTTTTATDICWRASYGRGVGAVPQECNWESQGKSGLLCYPKCKAGYTNVAGVCWASCPAGYRDDGAFCRKAEYGRGESSNTWALWNKDKCDAANKAVGGCEQWGAFVYAKCKPGYTNFGCCICRPIPINCPPGWQSFLNSCAKPSYVVAPITPHCGDKQYDAGLCYTKCQAGFSGVGPVCWGECPKTHPINCGAACAKSDEDCKESLKDMIFSVGKVAVDIASAAFTAGTSYAAQASAKVALKAAMKQIADKLLETFKKKAYAELKGFLAKEFGKFMSSKDAKQMEEMVTDSGFDFANLDPTGIVQIVQAYNKPICKVDPSIPPAPPLAIKVEEVSAIGPNPCAHMIKDGNYKNVVGQHPSQWSEGTRNTGITILGKATGVDLSGWPNEFLYKALTMNCYNMTKYPDFDRLYVSPPDRWSDDDHNAAIVIVGHSAGIGIGSDDPTNRRGLSLLQGLSNQALASMLFGKK